MKVAALIPAYNEEKFIGQVVKRTIPFVQHVLVVDDGSKDNTVEEAKKAGAEVIVHQVNLGKGMALTRGLNELFDRDFSHVICLDSDGQHLPEEIPSFLEIKESADLVIGNRMSDTEKMPLARLYTNIVTSKILSILAKVRVPDTQCGFRMINKACWKGINIKTKNYDFEGEMIVKAGRKGFKIASAPVSTIYADEVSTINPMRDTIRFFKMIWRLWWEK